MADVALVFHWPPAVMEQMDLGELMGWHARAVDRFNKTQGGGGKRG